jgi:hypothetical protein
MNRNEMTESRKRLVRYEAKKFKPDVFLKMKRRIKAEERARRRTAGQVVKKREAAELEYDMFIRDTMLPFCR